MSQPTMSDAEYNFMQARFHFLNGKDALTARNFEEAARIFYDLRSNEIYREWLETDTNLGNVDFLYGRSLLYMHQIDSAIAVFQEMRVNNLYSEWRRTGDNQRNLDHEYNLSLILSRQTYRPPEVIQDFDEAANSMPRPV